MRIKRGLWQPPFLSLGPRHQRRNKNYNFMTQTPAKRIFFFFFQDFETNSFSSCFLLWWSVFSKERGRVPGQDVNGNKNWTSWSAATFPWHLAHPRLSKNEKQPSSPRLFKNKPRLIFCCYVLKNSMKYALQSEKNSYIFCGVRQEESCFSVDQGFFLFLQETI